jgi:hypothetical protein
MILSSLSGTDFPDPTSPEFLEGQGKVLGYKLTRLTTPSYSRFKYPSYSLRWVGWSTHNLNMVPPITFIRSTSLYWEHL